MAGTSRWKVYNPKGEYVAACKHAEDAACLVAFYGDGATIHETLGFAAATEEMAAEREAE